MDFVSKDKRSKMMSGIKSKNTKPEILIRSLLHRYGYRFTLHKKDIPGKPDIVLSRYKTAVFVHGCYWHRHKRCKKGQSTPSSNTQFWLDKFERNVARDNRNVRDLKKLGWSVITIWECETKNIEKLKTKLFSKMAKIN